MDPLGGSSLSILEDGGALPLVLDRLDEDDALCAALACTTLRDALFAQPRHIPEAYVIYDEAYPEARALIHSWLQDQDILSTGRYGDWNYSSMEDALLNGREAAAWLRS